MHIIIIVVPKRGLICKIPESSTIDLVLKRLYIQSTKKNISADNAPWVIENNIPPKTALVSPHINVTYIIFISCIVPYATSFFKSV